MIKTSLKLYEKYLQESLIFFEGTRVLLDNFEKYNDVFDLDTIFFHLQQSIEKILKSLLDYNDIKFTNIRDLEVIVCLLRSNKINIIPEVDYVTSLFTYSVYGRYKSNRKYLRDAEEYYSLIRKIIKFVRKEISLEA